RTMEESIHHPAAKKDNQREQETVERRSERHDPVTGQELYTAQEDRVEGWKIHQRHVGEIVDRALVVDMLGGADIDDGIRGDADAAVCAKSLDDEEPGDGHRDGVEIAGQ